MNFYKLNPFLIYLLLVLTPSLLSAQNNFSVNNLLKVKRTNDFIVTESGKIAVNDHKALREIVQEIKSNPKNESIPTDFASKLEKHIRLEERELFNELQNTLSESELNIVAEKMEKLHPDKKEDNWKDAFWVKLRNQ